MKPKRAVKQLERQLRSDPENLVLRVKLATALREVGRTDDAAALYRSVAVAYHRQGRIVQGIAVLRSALEVEPNDPRTLELLTTLERVRDQDARYAAPPPEPVVPARPRRRSSAGSWQEPPSGPRRQSSAGSWQPEPPSRPRRRSSPEPWEQEPPSRATPDRRSRPPGVPDRRISRPLTVPSLAPGAGMRLTPSPAPRRRSRSSSSMPPAVLSIANLPDDPSDDEMTVLHDPAGSSFDDAATRVATAGELAPHIAAGADDLDARSSRPTGRLSSEEVTVYRPQDAPGEPPPPVRRDTARDSADPVWVGGGADPEALERTHVFDRSFADVLGALAPDGSAIEVPMSLFSELPKPVLEQLARGMTVRQLEPGRVVIREGDPGDACYVVAAGDVRVLKRDPTATSSEFIEVARLGQGSVFGEFALLADRHRHATVQAVTQCELFEIPRQLVQQLAGSFPELGPMLERFCRERLLATLLTTAPLFQPLPAERRTELLARFRPQRSEPGWEIIREGQAGGGLYLIVLGQVEITKHVPRQQRSVLLATLGDGAYFGEMSLLQGGVASASVIATRPTELAVLPADDFYALVAEYPVLWDVMRREAGRRELEIHKIIAGDTSLV